MDPRFTLLSACLVGVAGSAVACRAPARIAAAVLVVAAIPAGLSEARPTSILLLASAAAASVGCVLFLRLRWGRLPTDQRPRLRLWALVITNVVVLCMVFAVFVLRSLA